jgi:hypothetical protein
MKLLYSTIRWENKQKLEELRSFIKNQQTIMMLWHNKTFLSYSLTDFKQQRPLISSHSDGEIIALIAKLYRIKPIRGSSNKNAFKALKEIMRLLQGQDTVCFAPDGPRGPKYNLNTNMAFLSSKFNVPIIFFNYETKNKKVFNSWDNFEIVKPFSQGRIDYIIIKPEEFLKQENPNEYIRAKCLKLVNAMQYA